MRQRALFGVAQSGTLLFRRLAVGKVFGFAAFRRLPICDTADCQSALRVWTKLSALRTIAGALL